MKKQQLLETINFLKLEGITNPEIGIVLGTGLGGLVREINIEVEISYDKIPHFPLSGYFQTLKETQQLCRNY